MQISYAIYTYVLNGLQVAQFLYRQLGLESGSNAVITNGRVSLCGPFLLDWKSIGS